MTDITAGATPEHEPASATEPGPAVALDAPPPGKAREPHPWTDDGAHPWRRYFARMIDSFLFGVGGMMLWMIIGVFTVPDLAEQAASALDGPLIGQLLGNTITLLFAIPALAVMIALTGGTPGKWLFGVRVTRPDGTRLSLGQAFMREGKVMIMGLGAGIPLLGLLAGWQAKEALENDGETSWDEGLLVTHRPMGVWHMLLSAVGLLLWAGIMIYNVYERFVGLGA